MKRILLVLQHDKVLLFHAEGMDGNFHYEAERFWADYFLHMPNGKGDLSPLVKRLRKWQSLWKKKDGLWRLAILVWPDANSLAESVLNKLSHIKLPICGEDDNVWQADDLQSFFREHTEYSSVSFDDGVIKTNQADVRLIALHGKCNIQCEKIQVSSNLPKRIKPPETSMVIHLDWDKPINKKINSICLDDSRITTLLRYFENERKS